MGLAAYGSQLRISSLAVSSGMIAALCGCGGTTDGPAVLAPVSGSVLIENQPAGGVAVAFVPVNGTGGTGAYGATGEDGTFTLLHQSGEPGIEPGTYKVVFSRWRMPNGDPIPEGQSAADVGAIDMVPLLYRDPERTRFTETIAAEGKQDLKFQM